METERILLIVGRVENNLSVRDSCFRHSTLMAITVGSRQMVAYTYIRTWRFRKGPRAVTTAAYPKTNRGI
jgi:hypothetical protein